MPFFYIERLFDHGHPPLQSVANLVDYILRLKKRFPSHPQSAALPLIFQPPNTHTQGLLCFFPEHKFSLVQIEPILLQYSLGCMTPNLSRTMFPPHVFLPAFFSQFYATISVLPVQ